MSNDLSIPIEFERAAESLHKNSLRLARLLRTTQEPGGPGLSKLGILVRLHQQGSTTASDLATYLGLQPQSLTRILAAMEISGQITRTQDPGDRRQSMIDLTPAGHRILADELGKRRRRLAQAMSQVLTPAETSLLQIASGLMEKVAAALESTGHPPPTEEPAP